MRSTVVPSMTSGFLFLDMECLVPVGLEWDDTHATPAVYRCGRGAMDVEALFSVEKLHDFRPVPVAVKRVDGGRPRFSSTAALAGHSCARSRPRTSTAISASLG